MSVPEATPTLATPGGTSVEGRPRALGGGPGISAARLEAVATELPFDLRPIALAAAARLAPRLPGGEVYTDDHAPVEWLIDDSPLEYAGG